MYNNPNQSNQQNPCQQPQSNPNQPPYQPQFNPIQPGQQQPYNPGQQYPPQQPPKAKHTKRNLGIGCGALIIVLALCGIVAVATNKGANTGTVVASSTTSTQSSTTSSTKTSTSSAHFKVGQVVKVGDWQVTVNSVKTSQGSTYVQPQKGQFLLLDVSVVNTSSTEQSISSLLNFKLMDSTGISYTETITGDNTPNPPDGKVEAGSPARGTFTYDVPTSIKNFTFVFEPSIVSGGESVWDITA